MRRALPLLLIAALAFPLAASAKEEAKAKPTDRTYVELPTLNATSIRADGSRGVVTVDEGLDIPDPAIRAMAGPYGPRLRAAYLDWLTRYMAGLSPGAPPNADLMVTELQRVTDRTLGKPGARFLIGSILVN